MFSKIVSTLPLAEQASCLREFIAVRGASLSALAANNVCRVLTLDKPAEPKGAARKLIAALAAHGVIIKYTHALELLARLGGQANWMRTRQASLFDTGEKELVAYALQAVKDGQTYVTIETFQSMAALSERLLALLALEWPKTLASSLGILGFGSQMLVLELEHPTAPWLQFKLCRFVGSTEGGELGDIPSQEAHLFSERITQTLEYAYPGLLVMSSVRCSTLSPEYNLCATVHQEASGGPPVTCWGDYELIPVLDGLDVQPTAVKAGGALRLEAKEGMVQLTPNWSTNADSMLVPGELTPKQLNSLIKRILRLRRLTGASVTQHLSRVMSGLEDPKNYFPVDKTKLDTAMKEASFTPKQLSLLSGLTLNAVQRILKYGYAHETAIPKISSVLGLAHPNYLLPDPTEDGTGIRIEEGGVFLRALSQTHMWHRLVSDSFEEGEKAEVSRIAETLQEYVEILQFRTGPFNETIQGLDTVRRPFDEGALARDVQELLDELTEMGVAVVVSNEIRFANGVGRLRGMKGMPLHHGTLFFEKTNLLKSPRAINAAIA